MFGDVTCALKLPLLPLAAAAATAPSGYESDSLLGDGDGSDSADGEAAAAPTTGAPAGSTGIAGGWGRLAAPADVGGDGATLAFAMLPEAEASTQAVFSLPASAPGGGARDMDATLAYALAPGDDTDPDSEGDAADAAAAPPGPYADTAETQAMVATRGPAGIGGGGGYVSDDDAAAPAAAISAATLLDPGTDVDTDTDAEGAAGTPAATPASASRLVKAGSGQLTFSPVPSSLPAPAVRRTSTLAATAAATAAAAAAVGGGATDSAANPPLRKVVGFRRAPDSIIPAIRCAWAWRWLRRRDPGLGG